MNLHSSTRLTCLLVTIACPALVFATPPSTISIDDGGTVVLEETWTGWITSTTMDNSSTALLILGDDGVSLDANVTDYYGVLSVADGKTVYLGTSDSLMPGRVDLDEGYTATATLVKRNGDFSITGYDGGSSWTVALGGRAVLDLTDASNTGSLTLGKSLYLAGYELDTPMIRFSLTAPDSTPGTPAAESRAIIVTDGNIGSSDAANNYQIYADRHMTVDFSATSGTFTPGQPYNFTLATGTADFYVTGSPNITGNSEGLWTSISLSANVNSLKNIVLNATFDPLFQDDFGGYYGSFSSLVSSGQSGTMLKNWTLSSGLMITGNQQVSLNGHEIMGDNNTITIASGKEFTLSGSGTISNLKVSFADTSSGLSLIGRSDLTGISFESSVASGRIAIGDGTTSTSVTVHPSELTYVGNIRVRNGATLTIEPNP